MRTTRSLISNLRPLGLVLCGLVLSPYSNAQTDDSPFAVQCGRYVYVFDRAEGIAKQIAPTVFSYEIREWNNEVIRFGAFSSNQLNRYTGKLHVGLSVEACKRIPIPRPQF